MCYIFKIWTFIHCLGLEQETIPSWNFLLFHHPIDEDDIIGLYVSILDEDIDI